MGPNIRQQVLAICCFSVFGNSFFGVGDYSQMANLGSRTYSSTFWNIFGTSKNVTTYGPSDPLFITEIL